MSTKHTEFFNYRPQSWWSSLADELQIWWWDRKMWAYAYRNSRPEFRAGKRQAEQHVQEDIAFGYSADMIRGKTETRCYSQTMPQRPVPRLAVAVAFTNGAQVWARVQDLTAHHIPRLLVLDTKCWFHLNKHLGGGRLGRIQYRDGAYDGNPLNDSISSSRAYLVFADETELELICDQWATSGGRLEAYY